MGTAAHAVNRHVRSWRSVEERVVPWEGAWVAFAPEAGARVRRGASRRVQRALRLLGFRSLTASLAVRPDNLAGGAAAIRDHLEALAPEAPGLVFRLDALAPERQAAAERLWDARALARSYVETADSLAASAARLPTLPREAAMAESFRIGGEAVRRIVLDPLLPAPIVDVKQRRNLVRAMRRYDELGRRCWRGWTGKAVELAQSPGDGSGLADTRAARGRTSGPGTSFQTGAEST